MCKFIEVLVPLVNPNETESLLAEVKVKDGEKVTKGQVLAVFETTKSTLELESEADGYILGLSHQAGVTLRSGELLFYITKQAGQSLPEKETIKEYRPVTAGEGLPEGLRITQPALKIVQKRNIDLDSLPRGVLVTESMIIKLAGSPASDFDPAKVVIYGGGGHAKSLIDLIRAEGKYSIHGILDDNLRIGTRILDIPVLGGRDVLTVIRNEGIGLAVNAVGGIGSITPRLSVYECLAEAGFKIVTVQHPLAYVEPTAVIQDGCQLFYHSYIGSEARVGFGSIVNTGAIISHDCVLGDFVNISPGAILAGAVMVNDRALVGMGVTINLGVTVGAGARIGNSAVVKADVPADGVVRAGAVWPPDR